MGVKDELAVGALARALVRTGMYRACVDPGVHVYGLRQTCSFRCTQPLYFPLDTVDVCGYSTDMESTTTLDRMFCKSCKTSSRLPEGFRIDWMQVVPRIADATGKLQQHDCGNYLRGRRIEGRYSDKIECGEKCQSATGPACECKCRGENHGA